MISLRGYKSRKKFWRYDNNCYHQHLVLRSKSRSLFLFLKMYTLYNMMVLFTFVKKVTHCNDLYPHKCTVTAIEIPKQTYKFRDGETLLFELLSCVRYYFPVIYFIAFFLYRNWNESKEILFLRFIYIASACWGFQIQIFAIDTSKSS